jgi:hypothetical protein
MAEHDGQDPAVEWRRVEGGYVSAEAYPTAGEPDYRALVERLQGVVFELTEQNRYLAVKVAELEAEIDYRLFDTEF